MKEIDSSASSFVFSFSLSITSELQLVRYDL